MTKYGFTFDLKKEIGVARAVEGDRGTRENGVRFGVFIAEGLGGSVAVYEKGLAACFGDFEAVLLSRQWERSWGKVRGKGLTKS